MPINRNDFISIFEQIYGSILNAVASDNPVSLTLSNAALKPLLMLSSSPEHFRIEMSQQLKEIQKILITNSSPEARAAHQKFVPGKERIYGARMPKSEEHTSEL